jgi:murein L,D-transpeptidase YafK
MALLMQGAGRFSAALLLGWVVMALPHASAATERPETERAFARVVEALRKGQRQVAEVELAALLEQAPNFRAGHWLQAEMYRAVAGDRAAEAVADHLVAPVALDRLQAELQARAAAETAAPPDGYWPDVLIDVSGRHRSVIVVDLAASQLYLLARDETGALRLVRRHYASIGENGSHKRLEGDLRTPVGVYHVTRWIDGQTLPDLYGSGAFPVNYPNAWDRALRRTGHGIWLHGVPRATYTRAPRSSEGCVTMANDDLTALQAHIDIGQTPVVFADVLQWIAPTQVQGVRADWQARIEAWRGHWSARDTEAYLAHYDDAFTTERMDRDAFAAHKRRVNAGKTFIDVRLRDLDLWRYPGPERPTVLAEFTQDYRSDTYSSVSRKQQFWQQDPNGLWRIVREITL